MTQIKERPILFSAPMVRAILDGSKTQTRRIIKHQPGKVTPAGRPLFFSNGNSGRRVQPICPYGKVGDRLWVREKFQPIFAEGFDHSSSPYPDYKTGYGYAISYPATDGIIEWIDGDDNITDRCRPSIHMPRWASRILLEIISVRVERLQDITNPDAEAEGIEGIDQPTGADDFNVYWRNYGVTEEQADGWPWFEDGKQVESFKSLWESINGVGSWDTNPWVWVIEFKKVN